MRLVFRLVSVFLLKLYAVAAVLKLTRLLDIWLTFFASSVRLFTGAWVSNGVKNGTAKRPQLPIKLYEFEACPFCKKVREHASWLDLDLEVYPCPRVTLKQYGVIEGSRYRGVVGAMGKTAFPYIEDPNTGTKMYESSDIIEYLYSNYGQGCTRPFMYRTVPHGLNMLFLFLSGIGRILPAHGVLKTPSELPEKPLEFWQYEASSYCKIVRELLCSLELPYICHNIARGSPKRDHFLATYGKSQFPFLHDPNTGVKLFDSDKIINYLKKTYQTGEAVQETIADYSTKGAGTHHGTIGSKKQE